LTANDGVLQEATAKLWELEKLRGSESAVKILPEVLVDSGWLASEKERVELAVHSAVTNVTAVTGTV
jgi:hypothetical protein